MKKIVVAITGASGTIYGIRILELLKPLDVETHLIISDGAKTTMQYECDKTVDELYGLSDVVHDNKNLAAKISSGSFKTNGMIVAPCSIKTMSEIAYGQTSSLIARAADVMLKERRKLVLSIRETPFHSGHLETMLKLSNMGAIIAPPIPSMYHKPKSIDELVTFSMVRALDLLDIETENIINRWGS